MLTSRVLSRASRSVVGRSLFLVPTSEKLRLPTLSNQFHSLVNESPNKFVSTQVTQFHNSAANSSIFQRFGFSSASPEPNEKEHGDGVESPMPNGDATAADEVEDAASAETKESGFNSETQSTSQSDKRRRRGTKRTAFSDSDSESESDLSRDDLAKLLKEKEELLKRKHEEIEVMKDKVLRSLAEMENVKERTRREAENSKKFAIQNFAKGLLDVADNLGRASSVTKESFSKLDASNDFAGAMPLLKSLLDGVEMTEKLLGEVFRKSGLEKYDPLNEPFDPHRHNAVFQVPDNSKPPGIVAHVLKPGYMLYDRVIRPAEVGVTHEVEEENKEA
ncbi:hypothetical protein Ddye_027635 [Dipteronia dyeriana]|uniref:GrpE protein homolog n=1 Tax=Dipteronia dyeriana TaxID=168575 RepID=A0AAD9WRM2_9ROSI|nr:hypothetical protein Ddye_027635 [Dipteronia dyeriana]